MKILDSYKKIAKEIIKESAWDRKFGEPLPTLEDVMKENKVKFKDKDGKDHEIDMDTAKQYKQDVDGGDDSDYKKLAVKAAGLDKDDKDSEQPSGKALGGSDFERDFDDKDDEPKSEPKSEPKDITGSIAGNEDAIDFAQALAQDLETNRSYQGLKDAGHEDLAKAIYYADSEEEKFDLVRKASEEPDEPESKSSDSKEKIEKEIEQVNDKIQDEVDSMNPDEDYIGKLVKKREELEDILDGMDETVKIINGQKYKAIKESKEPTKQKIHSFKKMYKRIGGK